MPVKQRSAAQQVLDEQRHRIRHSAAHIMAQAVLSIFPDARFAIGPATDDGFYYDFEVPRPFTPEDLVAIEEHMRAVIAKDAPFVIGELSRAEAEAHFAAQPYKCEIIGAIPQGEAISTYTHDGFTDLCRGPHVESTGQVRAFHLTHVAGAYWRGDEHNPMLQRIYGTAWESHESLEAHLARLEE
ncbi:MAG: threonine--tRNA ligase, partial [Chloroflexota bacterium]